MGFGALFLGFMFLFDFEVGLRAQEGAAAYAVIDLFPDVIGWILIFFGLKALSKYADGLEKIRVIPLFFIGFTILTVLKGTVFFSSFYTPDGMQKIAGETLDVCLHFLELGFVYVLFGFTASVCKKYKDPKLASSHLMVPRIVLVEGVLYFISRLFARLPLAESMKPFFAVISKLDYLFLVFLIWFGTIALVRAMVRLSDH